MQSDIGLIGLAVMGQNLAMNMADHGSSVVVYNRTASVTEEFIAGPAAGMSITGVQSVEALVAALASPRIVMLMVKAGGPVDSVIGQVAPLLSSGDIIIDGGNSLFSDTARRHAALESEGILFVGSGVSGGEEGARYGPSIMPGGHPDAWPHISGILQAIAAKADDGLPCCDWVGPGGAGHYVKMVHNGIEYGDMQVIAEAYGLMRAMGMSHVEMSATFAEWNDGVLDSFLIEITAEILAYIDDDGSPLVEKILDAAGQKGTGKWTVISSMELGQPVTLVAEAVFARVVSSFKEQRVKASAVLAGPNTAPVGFTMSDLRDALYASKIVSYSQGFMLLSEASQEYGWSLDLGRIASLWREGCIIRARFLDDIMSAYLGSPELENLLFDPFFTEAISSAQDGWRRVIAGATMAGVPVPAYSSALAFFDGYRSERVSANLIQAQRDYFGAHTYERVDRPRGETFHTNWTGEGGTTTAGSYDA